MKSYGNAPTLPLLRKHELLAALRQHEVFVLERGALEAYYPPEVTGADKPTSEAFCKLCGEREAVLGLCGNIPVGDGAATRNEFEVIFSGVFDGIRS